MRCSLSDSSFWWLIIETEGVYLGKRAVIALYDLYASRYDRVKQFDEAADLALISEPIMARAHPATDPLILDVATGTGRLPLIMARNGGFEGHVIGLGRQPADAEYRSAEGGGGTLRALHHADAPRRERTAIRR